MPFFSRRKPKGDEAASPRTIASAVATPQQALLDEALPRSDEGASVLAPQSTHPCATLRNWLASTIHTINITTATACSSALTFLAKASGSSTSGSIHDSLQQAFTHEPRSGRSQSGGMQARVVANEKRRSSMTDGVRAPIKPTQFCIASESCGGVASTYTLCHRNKGGACWEVLTTAAGA